VTRPAQIARGVPALMREVVHGIRDACLRQHWRQEER
jgi:hypothetical protein